MRRRADQPIPIQVAVLRARGSPIGLCKGAVFLFERLVKLHESPKISRATADARCVVNIKPVLRIGGV